MALSDTATILAVLDAQGLRTGADLSEGGLKRFVADYEVYMRSIDYEDGNPDKLPQAATMAWPDGSSGVWTRTAQDAAWGVVTAFTVTHTLSQQIATVTLATNLQEIQSIEVADIP